jgi:hypothetical protein
MTQAITDMDLTGPINDLSAPKVKGRGAPKFRYRIKTKEEPEWTYYNSINELSDKLGLIKNTLEVHYNNHEKGQRGTTMKSVVIHDIERANNKEYNDQFDIFTLGLKKSGMSEQEAISQFNDHIYK